MKISTIYFPNEEEYNKIKELSYKERKTISEIARESLEDYYKKHADGNPAFTLDQFNNESFLATPAFHRPVDVWEGYLLKCSNKEFKEFYTQLEVLLGLEKRVGKQR